MSADTFDDPVYEKEMNKAGLKPGDVPSKSELIKRPGKIYVFYKSPSSGALSHRVGWPLYLDHDSKKKIGSVVMVTTDSMQTEVIYEIDDTVENRALFSNVESKPVSGMSYGRILSNNQ